MYRQQVTSSHCEGAKCCCLPRGERMKEFEGSKVELGREEESHEGMD